MTVEFTINDEWAKKPKERKKIGKGQTHPCSDQFEIGGEGTCTEARTCMDLLGILEYKATLPGHFCPGVAAETCRRWLRLNSPPDAEENPPKYLPIGGGLFISPTPYLTAAGVLPIVDQRTMREGPRLIPAPGQDSTTDLHRVAEWMVQQDYVPTLAVLCIIVQRAAPRTRRKLLSRLQYRDMENLQGRDLEIYADTFKVSAVMEMPETLITTFCLGEVYHLPPYGPFAYPTSTYSLITGERYRRPKSEFGTAVSMMSRHAEWWRKAMQHPVGGSGAPSRPHKENALAIEAKRCAEGDPDLTPDQVFLNEWARQRPRGLPAYGSKDYTTDRTAIQQSVRKAIIRYGGKHKLPLPWKSPCPGKPPDKK